MSKEIIDDFSKAQKTSFAKKSFRQFLIALTGYTIPLLMFIFLKGEKRSQEWFSIIVGSLIIIGSLIALIGLINGIKSIRRKENSNKKYIATMGNFCFSLILIILLVNNLIDLFRYLSGS